MDRLGQLRVEAGGSGDSTLDTTSPPSEAYMSANESSKYFSFSDSTFDISPIKDVSLASTSADADRTVTVSDELISNLSPIGKNDMLDDYKIGKQIEAANILSGGVDIFDDNENSFDGNELVIDDNIVLDDKLNPDNSEADQAENAEPKLPLTEAEENIEPAPLLIEEDDIEPAPLLIEPEEDMEPEPPLVDAEEVVEPEAQLIDAVEEVEPEIPLVDVEENIEVEPPIVEAEPNVANREMEVVLQIDGINVNAIDIGNGLYLYRKDGQQELAAIQIIEGDPQHSFKFLKVRDNAEGNLEVYEEIEIEVPKEVPANHRKPVDKNTPHVPIIDINKVKDSSIKEVAETKSPQKEPVASTSRENYNEEKETSPESKTEVNLNGKMKFSESRKSPVVGCSFTPMTYHSTPNKEGKPLTKTMVDLQLDPNRHSDNVKKTIEVHTDNIKQKPMESLAKEKDLVENDISTNAISVVKEVPMDTSDEITRKQETKELNEGIENKVLPEKNIAQKKSLNANTNESTAPKSETNTDKGKIAIANKIVTENQSTSTKSSENNQKTVMTEVESDKMKDTVLEKAIISNIDKESDVVLSKPDNLVVLQQSITRDTNDVATSDTIHNNTKKTIISDKTIMEKSKSININPLPNNSKDIDKSIKCKNDLERSTISKDTQLDKEKAKLVTVDESMDIGKNNMAHIKKVKSASLVASPEESKLESSMKSNEDKKVHQETVSDVASTSTNLETKQTKVKSVTPIVIHTDKSVPLLTPSNIIKTKQDTQNTSSKVSEGLSNISSTPNENSAIEKQKAKVFTSSGKETSSEANDKAEKVITKENREEESNNAVTISAIGEKTDLSVPFLKHSALPILVSGVKPTVKAEMAVPIPKAKLLKIVPHSTVPETNPSKTEANLSALTESGKSVRIIPATIVKPSEKATQSTPREIKHSEKAAHSTALPDLKLSKIASNTIIKITKPDGHLPIVANIANKTSSKHIPVLAILKPEGITITKANVKIANPKEVTVKNIAMDKNLTQIQIESREIKEPISKPHPDPKPANNNHTAAVPFGKWTEVNRQEFLNKFKEVKAPVSTNSKQIKNSNDLNRRDVLKKIDSQRAQTIINNATAKAQEKLNVKNETVFSSKVASPKAEIQVPVKKQTADKTPKETVMKVTAKEENPQIAAVSSTVPSNSTTVATVATVTKNEPAPRDLSTATMASLIDKTIEDMINRVVAPCKNVSDEPKQVIEENPSEPDSASQIPETVPQISKAETDDSGSLDDIEMKMNELHGIPFVERPPHELPKVPKAEIKTYSKFDKDKPSNKVTKISNIISPAVEPKVVKDNVIDIDSEEELIEHEPITGDIELNKNTIPNILPAQEKKTLSEKSTGSAVSKNASNKDASNKEAVITETDFDRFARRNSITYENCLTVNFDRKEPQNTKQIVKEKDLALKLNPQTDMPRMEAKSKLPQKQTMRHNTHAGKTPSPKFGAVPGNTSNKNYQSKIHSAYQSAMSAKHLIARPITIIEDKPVKVVFLESNAGFVPSQLNVQGQELSPAKKPDLETITTPHTESVDSDILETIDENKQQDKSKTKHQRKQVLTPVEAPDLELIQPSDIGIEVSPKKKRKIEEPKTEKQTKNLVPKKSYLLGRNMTTDDKTASSQILAKEPPKEIINRSEEIIEHKDAASSAIDSLVKAAELLENQAETSINNSTTSNPENQPNTPVKRGRGRPRKYPLPEGAADSRTPSPQKKPRLIDAKPIKPESISDEPDDDSSGEGMIRENWTMGKINENIVCPICYKLFRSENVVFKHVKHCTGVSPNRSDSDKRSPRRARLSQESEDMDMDYEDINEDKKDTPSKRKSKESIKAETKLEQTKPEVDKDDVIVVEDIPIKERPEKNDKKTEDEPKTVAKAKVRHRSNSLVCEFCGKTFRQLSYLASHKMQHKKEQTNKIEKSSPDSNKSQVFNCEVCKKEFRKLHHLVQHRIIHNPDSVPKRQLRKSSSEQNDTKHVKEETAAKQSEDPSAAFRCEPCDKSFRKLHHLVEHRETHDGINKQKPVAPAQLTEKSPPPPQCEICKKTFRKLHHLIEHKEQHADTSSEKSDDKSVKSSLSTRDIIHECSLCYMVFPNEHSLTKHSAICSRKKRQSKQPKDVSENESVKEEESKTEEKKDEEKGVELPKIDAEQIENDDEKTEKEAGDKNVIIPSNAEQEVETEKDIITEIKQAEQEKVSCVEVVEKPLQKEIPVKSTELQSAPAKRDFTKSDADNVKETSVVPEKIKKVDHKEVKTQETPKKKTPLKNKVALAVTKRQKTIDAPPPAVEVNPTVESSDDDEVRYMLNPNYVQFDETIEAKTFMKVRANKRNSLQIERPKSNELMKRRTSFQLPPKIPRLKPKTVEPKFKAAEPKLKAVEPKLKAVEPKLKSVETKLKAVEPKLKSVETKLNTVEPKLKAAEPKLKAVEPKRKAVEPKLKAVESKQKAVEPKLKLVQPKSKVIEAKTPSTTLKHIPKLSEAEALATDSDDSDVKYSFPKITPGTSKVPQERTPKDTETKIPSKSPAEKRKSKDIEKKFPRKSLAEKRKSLGGIAKRKSVGKAITAKHKVNNPAVKPIIRKRMTEAEHRCDCGELFSSAALLSRHTSLAHTPPRIRRRRSPPPEPMPAAKPVRTSKLPDKTENSDKKLKRKSNAKSEASTSNAKSSTATRKSNVRADETPPDSSKKFKSAVKTRRSLKHSGVPIPETMRKLLAKGFGWAE